ncbi:PepSY domain-containing protein [Planococcus sp. 1R117A]|uniref:PepSY domain-containing protein n=1 Tax=Planococcus sp. 1R117A TaxID=3447020 RepID=UPI003EDC21AC
MKRFVYIPVIAGALTFGGIVLANTDSNPAGNTETNSNNSNVQSSNQQASQQAPKLTFEEASAKALEIANGTITDIELERESNRSVYEVDVAHEGFEYDLKFDANTGEVLEQKREREDNDDDDSDDIVSTEGLISSEEATAAALAVANGKVKDMKLDNDDGVVQYEFEIENGSTEHEVTVNAKDGSIIKQETDDDDDNNDDD